MRYSEKNIDMLTGSLYRSILFFTIPIALIVALSSGLSVGVNVLVAQQIGQHKEQNTSAQPCLWL